MEADSLILSKYYYLLLQKGVVLNWYKSEFPLHKDVLCLLAKLVEIGPVVLEKKILKFRKCIFAISK